MSDYLNPKSMCPECLRIGGHHVNCPNAEDDDSDGAEDAELDALAWRNWLVSRDLLNV